MFDKWTGNVDSRQVVFVRDGSSQAYRAVMIDNRFCFNGAEWDFPNAPRSGLSARPSAYQAIRGMEAFEHWLEILESISGVHLLDDLADGIPAEWYGGEMNTLRRLLQELDRRRSHVRASLWTTRSGSPQCFPNWTLCRLTHRQRGQSEAVSDQLRYVA